MTNQQIRTQNNLISITKIKSMQIKLKIPILTTQWQLFVVGNKFKINN